MYLCRIFVALRATLQVVLVKFVTHIVHSYGPFSQMVYLLTAPAI